MSITIIDDEIKTIINEKDIKKKYSLIYDYICDYLDRKMQENNYCDFKDGKCIANRLGKSVHLENGCCYQYKKGICKYLVNGVCTNKNISCKFFMCSYIESKIVKFNIDDIIPVKLFFNRKQKRIIKKSYFKKKEEIIELLLKYK